jgi:hypothetical protein
MSYDKLVAALRCKRDDCEGCDLAFFDKDEGWMCQYAAKDDDAADAIEALLKENKELIEDRPEMVEDDGHWEWRKPNGEVLMPKQGECVLTKEEIKTIRIHMNAFKETLCNQHRYNEAQWYQDLVDKLAKMEVAGWQVK